MEAALRKGRPLPDWYLDEPQLLPGENFYMEAFWELSTCRPAVGMSMGPIPWDKRRDYGLDAGLNRANMQVFHTVLRKMDAEYLKWEGSEAERRRRQSG